MKRLLLLALAITIGAGCSKGEGIKIPVPDEAVILINEVNTDQKYIELYNPTMKACDLSGFTLRKNNAALLQNSEGSGDYRIAEGTTLPAGGYAVLGCKGQSHTTEGVDLGVSKTGISGSKSLLIELLDRKGRRIDYFVNSAHAKPRAVDAWDEAVEHRFDVAARIPDGGRWNVVVNPTAGKSNSTAAVSGLFLHTEVDFEAKEPNEPIGGTEQPDAPDAVTDGLSYIFDLEALPEIRIEVSLSEWNRLLTCYDADMNTDEYIHCDATFTKEGRAHSFTDAGLRLRGNTSRRRPEGEHGQMHQANKSDWRHVHFMLNLRKFVKDDAHELGGVRKIHLKWCKDDPTYVREMYCYNLFRRYGIEAGLRTSYGRLWIHVEGDTKACYYGVYELLEAIDEEYLEAREEHFGSADHFLWKCGYGAGLNDTSDWMFRSDEDAGTENLPYVLKTNTDRFATAKAQLVDFIRNLNNLNGTAFREWVSKHVDVELLLRTYAVNVAVGMWDDYWCNQNNYYIYFNSSSTTDYQFFFIPYDYDNTLGTSLMIDAGRQNPLQWGDNSRKLIAKLLEYDDWRAIYLNALRELCASDELFGVEGSLRRIAQWQTLIRPYVSNDTGEDMTIYDEPGSWGNHPEYRLMDRGANNFFRVKAASIPAQ